MNWLSNEYDQVFIQFVIQLLISESIFLIHKERRNYSPIRLIGSTIALGGVGFLWTHFMMPYLEQQHLLSAIFYLGVAVLTYFWILFNFEMNALETFFTVAGGYATEHMAYTVTRVILYAISQNVSIDTTTLWYYLSIRFFVYIIMAVIIYWTIVRKNGERVEFREGDYRVIALSLVLMATAVFMSVYYNADQYEDSVLSQVICPIYGFICCVLVLLMVYYVFWTKKMLWEKESMEQLIRLSQVQQKSTKESMDIINIKCHDLKHQIRALARMNDEAERSEYVKEIQEAVSIYDAVYHTGNEALDYVLREKTLISNEFGIKFSCIVDGSLLSFISSADMYALMSNAIDNAFESVLNEAEEKRVVSLQIRQQRKTILIHMENWCSVKTEFKNGLPVTNKKDKQNHGFGVKSIRYIVNKYNGELMMKIDQQKFILDIMFPVDANSIK